MLIRTLFSAHTTSAKNAKQKYYIDPLAENFVGFECIREKATAGIKQVIENLENKK